jgi:hypothetical protein
VVYIIEAVGTGRVKIGHTMGGKPALMSRLAALQTGSPLRLVAIAVMAGGPVEEKRLHRRFRRLHERGEWFRKEGDLADFAHQIRLRQPLSVAIYVPRGVGKARRRGPRPRGQAPTSDRVERLRSDRWHPLDELFDD